MASSRSRPRSTPGRAESAAGLRAFVLVFAVFLSGLLSLVRADDAAHGSVGGLPSPTLRPPAVPFSAVRLFDRPASAWGPGHRGIDIEAAAGDTIRAPGDGVVTFAGVVVDRGVVTVDHGGTLRSSVEPIEPVVVVGDHVRAGDPLGVVSDAPGHCAPATCVHWGVRFGDEYVNPLDVLVGYGRIVLLP